MAPISKVEIIYKRDGRENVEKVLVNGEDWTDKLSAVNLNWDAGDYPRINVDLAFAKEIAITLDNPHGLNSAALSDSEDEAFLVK